MQKQPQNNTAQEQSTVVSGLSIKGDISHIFENDKATQQNTEQPQTPQQTEPTSGDSDNKRDISEGFKSNYEGKSPEELIRIIHDKEQHIGKQSNELGELRKLAGQSQTKQQTLQEQRSEVQSKLDDTEDKLDDYDSNVDKNDKAYKKLVSQKRTLERQLRDLDNAESMQKAEEMFKRTAFEQHNKGILQQKRSEVASFIGATDIPQNIWDNISDIAQSMAGAGNTVTNDDIYAAVYKVYGHEYINKLQQVTANTTVRQDINKANSMSMQAVTGKQTSYTVEDMTEAQQVKLLEHLWSTGQHDNYKEVEKKIKASRLK